MTGHPAAGWQCPAFMRSRLRRPQRSAHQRSPASAPPSHGPGRRPREPHSSGRGKHPLKHLGTQSTVQGIGSDVYTTRTSREGGLGSYYKSPDGRMSQETSGRRPRGGLWFLPQAWGLRPPPQRQAGWRAAAAQAGACVRHHEPRKGPATCAPRSMSHKEQSVPEPGYMDSLTLLIRHNFTNKHCSAGGKAPTPNPLFHSSSGSPRTPLQSSSWLWGALSIPGPLSPARLHPVTATCNVRCCHPAHALQ